MLPLELHPLSIPLSMVVIPEHRLPVVPLTLAMLAAVVAETIVETIVVAVAVSIPGPNLAADSMRSIALDCTGPIPPSMILLLTPFRENTCWVLLRLCLSSIVLCLLPCLCHPCPFLYHMARTFLLLGWCNP